MRSRRGGWLRVLVVFALLLLVACSGQSTAPGPEGDGDGVTDAAEGVKRGGVLKMIMVGEPQSLDPHASASYATHWLVGLSYSKLVTYATGPDVEYNEYRIVPDLAESWNISEDGLVYTFHLRKDARWHNIPPVNGRPVVADDVLVTMERIQTLPGHQAYMLEKVERIEAPDQHTVVFTLSEPFAPFLNYISGQFMWILPREGVEGQYDLNTQVIGSGPFILEKWDKGVETLFKKNPDYYQEGLPYLDGIHFFSLSDQGTRVAAFRTGQVDVLSSTGASMEDKENILRTLPQTRVIDHISSGHYAIYVNQDREPFNNLLVRKAISLAVDRQAMVAAIYGPGGEISGPVPPVMGKWALPLEEREAALPHNPEEAKRLLAEAGFPEGFRLKVTVTQGYGETTIRMAEWVVEDLRKIGIQAEVEVVEYSTYISQTWPKQQYDIIVGPQTPFVEADEWLVSQHRTGASRNWGGVSDPRLDEMLLHQRSILDEEERVAYVHDIQRYILENVMNPIPLVAPPGFTLVHPHVQGYYPQASYGYLWMKEVWLDK